MSYHTAYNNPSGIRSKAAPGTGFLHHGTIDTEWTIDTHLSALADERRQHTLHPSTERPAYVQSKRDNLQTINIVYTGWVKKVSLIISAVTLSTANQLSLQSSVVTQTVLRPKKIPVLPVAGWWKIGMGGGFFILFIFSFLWQYIPYGTRCPRMWILAR